MRLNKGIRAYTLPRDLERVVSVCAKKGTRYYGLQHMHIDHLISIKHRPAEPIYFAICGDEIIFCPTPDKAYYVEITHTRLRRL